MAERIDEMKGNVKRGVGKVTGNEDLEAEGTADATAAKASRETKGAVNRVKGGIKEGVGELTGDEATRAQGTADRLKGETQQRG